MNEITTSTTHPTSTQTSWIRRRLRGAVVALALPMAVAAPMVAATPAHAAVDCTTDCLAVAVTPGVDRAQVIVNASPSAKIAGRITAGNGSTLATLSSSGYTASHGVTAFNLKQGTPYKYDVYGTDPSGNTWREVGYFATLVRDVAVHFDTLEITDDGDSGGAGELVGGVQLLDDAGTRCSIKPLAPLNMTSTTSMSSGAPVSVAASADLLCPGTGPSVGLQSHLADDDTDSWDDCSAWWPWNFESGSWLTRGGNDCADWNYGKSTLNDPLPALGVAATSVPFTLTSIGTDWNNWDAGPEWILTGSVAYGHHAPALSLPATTGSRAKLPLTVTPERGGFTATWSPVAVPGVTVADYLVQWRPTGAAGWISQSVSAAATSTVVSGLQGSATYDVQIVARESAGFQLLRGGSTVTTLALTPTTISGWTGGSQTLAPGSTVPFSVTVSGDTARPVKLQTRRQGEQAWGTYAVLSTNPLQVASGDYPVLAGIHEWRIYAPQNNSDEAATSAVRTVTARSSITGFATTKVVTRAGTIIEDAITVTPGAGRQVTVQFRRAGTTTWRTFQTLTASGTGQVTVKLKAYAGTRYWRVRVAKSPMFGSAATTASRLVRGR